ncbi:hypothetical protein GCM10010345_89670 [Streptomyces canarius]|uniref:Uncharacterized protein n=1 Tax=Streptomyces canarius TaxID=285453 RepID=A0ABQ3DDQ3_9ACTN|nr:hypothetical protein GCM10010345_89670 [Streptomyces canarius]
MRSDGRGGDVDLCTGQPAISPAILTADFRAEAGSVATGTLRRFEAASEATG